VWGTKLGDSAVQEVDMVEEFNTYNNTDVKHRVAATLKQTGRDHNIQQLTVDSNPLVDILFIRQLDSEAKVPSFQRGIDIHSLLLKLNFRVRRTRFLSISVVGPPTLL
jgi:hypothetical protein